MEYKAEESCGNIFADLGLSHPEARAAKAELCIQIRRIIRDRKLTQTEAAKLLEVEQLKISQLMNGRVSGFSLGKFMHLLAILNCNIEIIIRPSSNKGHITVAVQ
jgi:predicted XRE-type DNA-binding protein